MEGAYWLEQTAEEMPVDDGWLGAHEVRCLAAMQFEKRRGDWRLGRWTAKRALSACLNLPTDVQTMRRIEIRATESGAPEAHVDDHPSSAMISISHCKGTAICAVMQEGAQMGCDLELVESRADSFLTDYFTIEEQTLVSRSFAEERPLMSTLLWSAKESALKALRTGLRLDTRAVMVRAELKGVEVEGWKQLHLRCAGYGLVGVLLFQGWWRYADGRVRTVVANALPRPPIRVWVPNCLDKISSGLRRFKCDQG